MDQESQDPKKKKRSAVKFLLIALFVVIAVLLVWLLISWGSGHAAVGTITTISDETITAAAAETAKECEAQGGHLRLKVSKNEIWLDFDEPESKVTGRADIIIAHDQECNGTIKGDDIIWFELTGTYKDNAFTGTATAGGKKAPLINVDPNSPGAQEPLDMPVETATWRATRQGNKITGVIAPEAANSYEFELTVR